SRPLSGERAVPVEFTDREVHVAACRVCVTPVDQPLDQLDHLGDVSGGAWRDGGWQTAERVESGLEGAFVFGRPRPPGRVGFRRLTDDLVVDVGDIAYQCHLEAVMAQPTS